MLRRYSDINYLRIYFSAITTSLAGTFSILIYFSPDSQLATVFIAGFYSLCSIATNATSLVVINQFPTSIRSVLLLWKRIYSKPFSNFRTTSLSLTLMFARVSSMVGNIVFPYLLGIGCEPPFIMMASLVLSKFDYRNCSESISKFFRNMSPEFLGFCIMITNNSTDLKLYWIIQPNIK